MTRLYAIDCNGLGHYLWHSKTRMDDHGNEISLEDATRRWWALFMAQMGPTHAVACFDAPDNWRYKVHVEYKSNRKIKPVDPDKAAALKSLPACWDALGVPVVAARGFEADDVIASIANRHASEDVEVIVVSSDKDMMQLVNAHVKQYDPRPNKAGTCVFYDEAAVEQKLKVPPHRVTELLALMGDAADHIPGVEGWGETRAVNAIRQTHSSREIFRLAEKGALDSILPKLQASLVAHRDDYDLSFKLASLRYDVPVAESVDEYRVTGLRVAA